MCTRNCSKQTEKLVRRCNDQQILELLGILAPELPTVACQKHGSFSIQALMESIRIPDQIQALTNALKPGVLKMALHSSGHFVCLKFLNMFPYPHTKFIFDAVEQHCLEMGTGERTIGVSFFFDHVLFFGLNDVFNRSSASRPSWTQSVQGRAEYQPDQGVDPDFQGSHQTNCQVGGESGELQVVFLRLPLASFSLGSLCSTATM